MSKRSKKYTASEISDRRNRISVLMTRINAERMHRLKERKEAIEINSEKNDLSITTERTDKNDSDSTDTWTPAYNAKFRELPQIHGDRDPTRRRVVALVHRIDNARQRFNWTDVYCKETKTTYRTNGNTSSWIATEFPELFEGARIFRTHGVADTYKEVQLIYAQHDPPVSDRSPAEVLRTWTTSFGILLQDKLINPILGAIEMARVVSKDQVKGGETLENKLDIITDNIDFYRWFHDNITPNWNTKTKNFLRVCFLTFIYLLYQMEEHREKVVEFLKRTIFSEQYAHESGDPCLALHLWMISNDAPKSDGDTWEYMRQIGKAILAWNAFATGRKITSVEIGGLYNNKPLPKIVGMSTKTRQRFGILTKNYIDPKKAVHKNQD